MGWIEECVDVHVTRQESILVHIFYFTLSLGECCHVSDIYSYAYFIMKILGHQVEPQLWYWLWAHTHGNESSDDDDIAQHGHHTPAKRTWRPLLTASIFDIGHLFHGQ